MVSYSFIIFPVTYNNVENETRKNEKNRKTRSRGIGDKKKKKERKKERRKETKRFPMKNETLIAFKAFACKIFVRLNNVTSAS